MDIDELLRRLSALIPKDASWTQADPEGGGNFRCEGCVACEDCKFCRDCQQCRSCTYCEGCERCEACTQSRRCLDCQGSSYLEDCRACRGSSYLLLCLDCQDCVHCLGCVGLSGAEFCVLNEQLSRKEYFAQVRALRAEIEARVQEGWRVDQLAASSDARAARPLSGSSAIEPASASEIGSASEQAEPEFALERAAVIVDAEPPATPESCSVNVQAEPVEPLAERTSRTSPSSRASSPSSSTISPAASGSASTRVLGPRRSRPSATSATGSRGTGSRGTGSRGTGSRATGSRGTGSSISYRARNTDIDHAAQAQRIEQEAQALAEQARENFSQRLASLDSPRRAASSRSSAPPRWQQSLSRAASSAKAESGTGSEPEPRRPSPRRSEVVEFQRPDRFAAPMPQAEEHPSVGASSAYREFGAGEISDSQARGFEATERRAHQAYDRQREGTQTSRTHYSQSWSESGTQQEGSAAERSAEQAQSTPARARRTRGSAPRPAGPASWSVPRGAPDASRKGSRSTWVPRSALEDREQNRGQAGQAAPGTPNRLLAFVKAGAAPHVEEEDADPPSWTRARLPPRKRR